MLLSASWPAHRRLGQIGRPLGSRRFRCPALLLAGLLFAALSLTETRAKDALAPPSGEVILTVSGTIARGNTPHGAKFDRAMLERLGLTTLATSTPWTNGVPTFTGVLARDLIDRLGATGNTVRAVALNDYAYEIPVADLLRYRVLLAMEMNGERLQVRDKGPIWIVFPLDAHDELRNRTTERKMVWQLTELQFR